MTRRHSVIVDQDGDGAECRLDGVERAVNGGAVEHVGFDRDRPSARRLNPGFHLGEPIAAPRHQADRRTVCSQHPGETSPQAAGCAGHQRHLAAEVKYFGSFHVDASVEVPATIRTCHARESGHPVTPVVMLSTGKSVPP